MLQINVLREEREKVITGLLKRNFNEASELVDKAIALDKSRREKQLKNDELLAEANKLAKEIGNLMK